MTPDAFAVLDDPRVAAVLRRLHRQARRQTPSLLLHYLPKLPALLRRRPLNFNDAEIAGFYSDKFIALEPHQAAFCHLVARSIEARLVVEFGTSFGVSTIWLAAAVRANGGGTVVTTELGAIAQRARQHIAEAGLSDYVDIRVGDALHTMTDLPDGHVDMLLNDGFPTQAIDVVDLMKPKLRPGAVVITDNVGTFGANYRQFLAYVRDPGHGYASVTVPFKSGTEYSVRLPGPA